MMSSFCVDTDVIWTDMAGEMKDLQSAVRKDLLITTLPVISARRCPILQDISGDIAQILSHSADTPPEETMNTVKPVYNDHLMGYFSVFWSSSRWPRATQMSSRRQKLLARVNWYLQSSLNILLNKSQVINFILEVVITDRYHCNLSNAADFNTLHETRAQIFMQAIRCILESGGMDPIHYWNIN